MKAIISLILLIGLTQAGFFGNLYDGMYNPKNAKITVTDGKKSFEFDSSIWHYRTKGTDYVEGVALLPTAEEIARDNINFFKSVTVKATEAGKNELFTSVDFRLAKNCEFTDETSTFHYRYSFNVRGTEDYKDKSFKVTVEYGTGSGFFGKLNFGQIMEKLNNDCKARDELIKKAEAAYITAAANYFAEQKKFEENLKKIDSKTAEKVDKAAKELEEASNAVEEAKKAAHEAAKKTKEDATGTYDEAKEKFDQARDHLVGVVRTVKDQVAQAHEANNVKDFKKGIENIECDDCYLY